MKYIRWFITAALCIGVALPHCVAEDRLLSTPQAIRGVIDLRSVNLNDQTIPLHGEWAFYWRRLAEPGQPVATPAAYLPFPSRWQKNTLNGEPLPSQGYATYTLTILLPAGHPQLGLLVPDTYCSYRLYVNGALLASNGKPDSLKQRAVPFWTTQAIALPAQADTLHLLLQVANFWHSKGGPYKEIFIGEKESLFLNYLRSRAYDLLLAGCLIMGGLFFFGFYLFGNRDKAILFFSLFCLVYSYRMVGTSMYVLHSVFPHLSWFITIRIEYLTLTLSVILFARYFQSVYPKDANPVIVNMVVGLCGLYTLIIATTPPQVFTKGITVFLGLMFFYIGFAFFICIRAVKHKRVGALFALLSCGVMLAVFFVINLNYFGAAATDKWIVFTGYVLFFFLQSLVLSHRFAFTLKEAAEEARQGLKAKTEFLSTMSHEIRTPLNVVIGMANLLLKSTPRKDQEKNLNVLLFSAKNLLTIVNDILDYNKIEAGKVSFEMIPMDILSIVYHITNGLGNQASEKGILLKAETDVLLTRKVIGDPTRTSQVIYNLVNNAVKFTEKGSVVLSVKTKKLTDTSATLTISVTDTGIGIAPEKQQLIFDRFTQADSSTSRSYGGTGLGLAITKRILQLQGVDLNLRSEPGKGSEFYFTQTFSLSSEPVEEAGQPAEKANEEQVLQGVHILVVEDNPFNVMVAQSLLERSGAIVDVASNGEEALEKIQPGKYRVVLMDLNMPVMDGFEATRHLRQRGETVPIIALTANLPGEVEQEVRQAGLTDMLVKPFNPDELFSVILHYIH